MSEVTLQNHNVGLTSYRFTSLSFHVKPIPEIQNFQNLTLKIQGQGQITMTLYNYRSRQVHETSNGVNPSSGFRGMRSAKSGPNLCQIWQVFGPWASPYWANGRMTMTVHNYRPRQFHRTSNGENPSSSYRDMGSASLAAGRPPARTVMGEWPWQCTTTGLDYSTELRTVKIHQAVTEIWVPQVWQPAARPPGPWRQYPSSPEGWGVKSILVEWIKLCWI